MYCFSSWSPGSGGVGVVSWNKRCLVDNAEKPRPAGPTMCNTILAREGSKISFYPTQVSSFYKIESKLNKLSDIVLDLLQSRIHQDTFLSNHAPDVLKLTFLTHLPTRRKILDNSNSWFFSEQNDGCHPNEWGETLLLEFLACLYARVLKSPFWDVPHPSLVLVSRQRAKRTSHFADTLLLLLLLLYWN